MKINEFINEDGRIVQGVNTTVDVKPGETERQARKFFGGNGQPKPLDFSGATPHVAFNLGMINESYKLQLERGDGMDILHILDTKTGHRTEVRGKPNFEIDYDPNDPLHKVINSLGKSANISDFVNGEVVTINPKHPDAEKAKAATDVAFNESTDLDSLRKFVKSQREAPDQVLYQMMMAPDTYGHSASNFVRSWYEKTKEENGLNDVDSALEIMVDELGLGDVNERKLTKKEIKKRDKYADDLPDAEFKKRYGKDWEAVKYGTATNMAKRKSESAILGAIGEHGLVPMYDTMKAYGMKRKTTNGQKHFVLDERKSAGIFQSAALKVLDNIASRRDGQAFPIKFYDGSTIKVKPETARKFINFYDDAEEEDKSFILNYLKTKKGFMELMQPKFIESIIEGKR